MADKEILSEGREIIFVSKHSLLEGYTEWVNGLDMSDSEREKRLGWIRDCQNSINESAGEVQN